MPGTIRPPDLEGAFEGAAPIPAVPAAARVPVPIESPRPQERPSPAEPRPRTSHVGGRPIQGSAPSIEISGPRRCPECGRRFPVEFKVCPHDAQDLVDENEDPASDNLLGATLNETYTITRAIGEGGMGRVYEARHTRLSTKRFAIKVLHPEYARQAEVLSRFQREAEAAASLLSPNVVGVHDVGKTPDGRPFMVADYLEGKELADYLTEAGPMSVPQAIAVVRQICKALILAHGKGVIHRDMKPENVFLSGDMRAPVATVLDFGISKIGDGTRTNLTKTGMIMGTPSYMAPEQARGDKVDHRADVYAVGAILYCALTGKRPFDHPDPMVTVTAVLTKDPPPPRSLEPSIPETLELIIQHAMAKEPEQRHRSMADLDLDLSAFDASATATPTSAISAPHSPTMLGPTLNEKAQAVRMAWPLLMTLAGLAAFWLLGTLISVIAGMIRLIRGPGSNLTGTEAGLLLFGSIFVLATPFGLVLRYLWKEIRNNRMRELKLVDQVRTPVVVALSGYGFTTLLVRVLDVVVMRSAESWGWPAWDLILMAVGAIGALGAYLLVEAERKRI